MLPSPFLERMAAVNKPGYDDLRHSWSCDSSTCSAPRMAQSNSDKEQNARNVPSNLMFGLIYIFTLTTLKNLHIRSVNQV